MSLEARDMYDQPIEVGDRIIFSTTHGLRIAKVNKIGLDYYGKQVNTISVEIEYKKARFAYERRRQEDPNRKPQRYSIQYAPAKLYKLPKEEE